MEIPLQITFKNMETDNALEKEIRERAKKLDKYFDHIMSCRVVVDIPHKHKVRGNQYDIRIDITVPPGNEIVVNRSTHDPGKTNKDPYISIKDAFNAAARQLEDYARRLRGDVKTHETPPLGVISELNIEEGFGRISSTDGKSIYFHKNSVLDTKFEELEVGMGVHFAEEQGNKGPQASTVKVIER